MRKLLIQKINEGKPLTPELRDHYMQVYKGSLDAAWNFIRLSNKYLNALKNDKDIGKYTRFEFMDLPPNLAFCLKLAFNCFREFSEAGIDLTDWGSDNFTLTIDNVDD